MTELDRRWYRVQHDPEHRGMIVSIIAIPDPPVEREPYVSYCFTINEGIARRSAIAGWSRLRSWWRRELRRRKGLCPYHDRLPEEGSKFCGICRSTRSRSKIRSRIWNTSKRKGKKATSNGC